MASKKPMQQERIISTLPLEDIFEDRFGRYSKYIIQDRALPDARDGLKPVQRRILYSMYKEGNTFEKATRKSAKTVGNVIGNYHPHGDSSVYEAMVRLSQSWKQRIPLIDMQGNNGSIDDDPAAAMRYTEARLAKISELLLKDLEKDTVQMAPNFDDTEVEPTVLPASYPNLLVNGTMGIAAGYATNMPPHNLEEVIDAAIFRIQNPGCTVEDIMRIMPGPDFPTGGIVQGKQGIIDAFTSGKGKVVVRSKTEILTQKNGMQQIIVTEIPYDVVKKNIVMKIAEIEASKDIDGIAEVRDESGRDGLRIVVDIKKDMDAKAVQDYLFKNTDLQTNYNYNNVAIVNKRPKSMGVLELLDAYIAHRVDVMTRRTQFDLDKKEKRCHILEGLMKMMSILDQVIQTIRESKDKADAKVQLMEKYQFTDVQAEAIVTLRLYRLTNFDIMELKNEFASLLNEMEELREILSDERRLRNVIIKDLRQIKKNHPCPRLTTIEDEVSELVINKSKMIANERVMVTISRDGYMKRASMRSYHAASDAMTGLKENDRLIGKLEVDTLDVLLCFTNLGNYCYIPVYTLDEAKWKDVGSHISKNIKVNNGEKIIDACVVKDFNTYAWVIQVTKNGMIKRTPMNQWKVERYSKAMTSMNIAIKDEVVRAQIAYDTDEVVLLSKEGYLLRYGIHEIPISSTKSKGVKAMKLAQDDEVVNMTLVNASTNGVVIMTEKGQVKRIRLTEINTYGRPSKGDLCAKKVKTNPNLMYELQAVRLYDEIIFFDGEVKKVLAKDVPLMQSSQTFSSAITQQNPWFVIHGITEVQIVDIPDIIEPMPENDDYEMLKLDL